MEVIEEEIKYDFTSFQQQQELNTQQVVQFRYTIQGNILFCL